MSNNRDGFTLIEMLVVIGIIVVLMGASIAGYSKMTKTADRAKAQELVANVATALTAYFQKEGSWPKRFISAKTDASGAKMLTDKAAYPLAKGKYLSLTTANNALAGQDQYGVLTHWGTAIMKRKGSDAKLEDVENHILRFEIDDDGDGIIRNVPVGSDKIDVRATAVVWCCNKEGKILDYHVGYRTDGIYSWTYGQTQSVK